jgi:hypothetical protein
MADKALSFGWRINGGADGFEQDHGRYVMEVWWHDDGRGWQWIVWDGATIVSQNSEPTLEGAKKAALRSASHLERVAVSEDKKFR